MSSNYIAFELDSTGSVWTHSWTGNYAISMNNTTSTNTIFINSWLLGTFSNTVGDPPVTTTFNKWDFNRSVTNAGIFVVRLSTGTPAKAHIDYVKQFAMQTVNKGGHEIGRDYTNNSPNHMFDSGGTAGMLSNHPYYADNSLIEEYSLHSLNQSLLESNYATRNTALSAAADSVSVEQLSITQPLINDVSNTTAKLETTSFWYDPEIGYSLDQGATMVTPNAAATYTSGIKNTPFTDKKPSRTYGSGLSVSSYTSGLDKTSTIKSMADRKSALAGKSEDALDLILQHLGKETYDEILERIS